MQHIYNDMKFHRLLLLAALCPMLSSCFKDEPANAECDIEVAWVHAEEPEKMFYNLTDTLVKVLYTDNLITFNVRSSADLSALAPQFIITPNATIEPASGSVQDFSHGPVTYKVTSEDRQWSREYYVSFNIVTRTETDTLRFDFEDYEVNSSYYYTWNDTRFRWSTGNPGYLLCGMATEYKDGQYSTNPEKFPSVALPDGEGYKGSGVKLTTLSTGAWGAMKEMRIAAGNLFIGTFDATQAMTDARKATNFGAPFARRPTKLRGHYKFTPGNDYQDADGNLKPGEADIADIYAVFYRNHDENGNAIMLDGDDVKSSPHIIGMAQVTGIQTTDEWTEFEAEFEFNQEIDQTLLDNRGYNIAIVFSSSVNGAYFEGAIGSTLMVDEVELICTDIK